MILIAEDILSRPEPRITDEVSLFVDLTSVA